LAGVTPAVAPGRWLTTWAPLRPDVLLRASSAVLPFPFGDPRCRLSLGAREGLLSGLEALGYGRGDEVLVSAYHHGSEVEALVRAGVTPRFFDVTDTLEPDEDRLEAALAPATRALVITHYHGFAQDGPRWRRWCDERGIDLIEDVGQSWLAGHAGRPLGAWGDLSVFSPWKTYGLADLGLTLAHLPLPDLAASRRPEPAMVLKSQANWLAQRWPPLAQLRWRAAARRSAAFDPAREFGVDSPRTPPSGTSLALLRRLVAIDAAAARRANHRRLLQALQPWTSPPFDRVPEESCPFFFPLPTRHREALMARLANAGIRALNVWAVPHPALPVAEHPRAAARRRGVVGLPVHQELRPGDVDLIAEATLEALAAVGETPAAGATSG
jgi:selenocysteine lyase/cysteine desulfurase